MNTLIAMSIDGDKLRDAFHGDGGFSWGDHHPCLFRGTEWFFRPGYRAFLTSDWIPALDGVEHKLEDGATRRRHRLRSRRVSRRDGRRVSRSRRSTASTSTRRRSRRPQARGRGGRRRGPHRVRGRRPPTGIRAPTTSSASSTACTTWATPSGSPGYAREHLDPAGPCCWSSPWPSTAEPPTSPRTRSPRCSTRRRRRSARPNSLSQEVGLGLGAQAGEARLREVFEEAGYTHFRRAAETPLNMILEARA